MGVVGATFLLITFTPAPVSEGGNGGHTVMSIDTQFSSQMLATAEGYQMKEETIRDAVADALKRNPQVIVLPEDSRYLQSNFNDVSRELVISNWELLHGETDTILIDSGRDITDSGETILRANVFDGVSNTLLQFDKQYLVPQGEYVPYIYAVALRLFGYGAAVEAVAVDSSYRPGPLVQTAVLPEYIPGVLFCFESVNPQGVMVIRNNRPLQFVAHPISHGWFHTPTIFWRQLDVMLQVQARYSGVPIVSAGNMVSGKLYLPSGEMKTGAVVETGDYYTLRQFVF
jgi:apolipoprotein N-acyltransferase